MKTKKYTVVMTEARGVDVDADRVEFEGGAVVFYLAGDRVATFKQWIGYFEVKS